MSVDGKFVVHVNNVQNPVDIPLNSDWFIGILITASFNPHISWIAFHPFYTANNQGPLFFTAELSTSMGVLLAALPIRVSRHHHFGDFWGWILGESPNLGESSHDGKQLSGS